MVLRINRVNGIRGIEAHRDVSASFSGERCSQIQIAIQTAREAVPEALNTGPSGGRLDDLARNPEVDVLEGALSVVESISDGNPAPRTD